MAIRYIGVSGNIVFKLPILQPATCAVALEHIALPFEDIEVGLLFRAHIDIGMLPQGVVQ